jgi:chromosome segregation ATPase
MIQLFLIILILLLPVYSDAAYKIYLKNGSVISGVSSFEKKAGKVTIYFGGGSLGISEKDILKIEETGAPEKDFRSQEIPEKQEKPEEAATAPSKESSSDKSGRVSALRAQLEAITSEIKTAEEEEARLTASINAKRGQRFKYNIYQLRQMEKEVEPLQQELFTIQQKKGELLQRKASIEGELKALE